jgi:hypothetical protein
MSNLTNPPGGGDPPDRFRNVGEQIQSFFDFAENNPDQAVPFFVNIWETQASLTTRALALQGLGVAAQHYHVKEALADWDVLRDIAKEVKGKGEVSNDLTRWAAASALEAIGYSQQSLEHLEGGGFTEPLDRIRREIRDRKLAEINRIQRLNSRGETTAEYERHLEFWIYGPADELLNGNENSRNYADIVGDVISKLHGRGVYLGLISPNSIVQGAALRQAGLIFKESAEIEEYLYGLLEEFLHDSNHEISLRINAAEIINTATDVNRSLKTLSKRLKTLSKLLLEERNPKLQEVALRQAQSVFERYAEIEEYLYQPLEEFLLNSNHEVSLRIHAAEIINTATDLSRRLKTLSKLFLEKAELRNAAVRLLTPYKHDLTRVEPDADTVLDALIFSYSLNTLQKPQLQDLTISQLETYFPSASQYHREISDIFTSAIAASEALARRYGRTSSVLKEFLQNKQDEYLSAIESWIQLLRNQISETETENTKVQSNQDLINESIERMGNLYQLDSWGSKNARICPFPEKTCVLDTKFVLHSRESHTCNQSYKILKDLRSIKFHLMPILNQEEAKQNKFLDAFLSTDLANALVFILILPLLLIFAIFFPLENAYPKKMISGVPLVLFHLAMLIISAVIYRLEGFIIASIVIMGISFISWYAKNKKRLKDLRSLIHKLNTQWKE